MNLIASLNLTAHDDGVAAISQSSIARDWLSIPQPPTFQSHPSSAPTNDSILQTTTDFLPLPAQTNLTTSNLPIPNQQVRPPPTSIQALPPLYQIPYQQPSSVSQPITRRQAASSIVRHLQPYAIKEVLVPCFSIANRFVLGRCLGSLHIPDEIRSSHISSDICTDSRFVLDLHYGSIVESRIYTPSNKSMCVAYTSKRNEYLTTPPFPPARVEIAFRHDQAESLFESEAYVPSIAPGATPSSLITSQAPHTSIAASADLELTENLPSSFHSPFQTALPEASRTDTQLQPTWQHFCANYGIFLPTGPLIATVVATPGPVSARYRKESINVTMNDPYAMSFCVNGPSQVHVGQARRIAPKRLLPRPT